MALEHVQNQTLSYHDPVTLTNQLEPSPLPSNVKKSSYFKASADILKLLGTMHTLQEVWETHSPLNSLDPTKKIGLAWGIIRKKYKAIQTKARKKEDPLEDLHAKLIQLKLDILEDLPFFQNEEFQSHRS